jgi:hypothetical protein
MKRILVLALVAVFMAGCSDDDGGSGKKLYLKSIFMLNPGGSNGELTFAYNDAKQITSLGSAGVSYNLTYEDNRLASITPTGGNGNSIYNFSYQDGILSSVKEDGAAYDVVYSSASRKYTIAGMEREFELTKDNDIAVVRELGANSSATPFTYSDKNKGGLSSMNTENNYLIFYFLNAPFYTSVKPITSYGIYTINNTYNSDGYVTRADFMAGTELIASFTYTYQEL